MENRLETNKALRNQGVRYRHATLLASLYFMSSILVALHTTNASAQIAENSSADPARESKVVNGHNATPGAWPFMVALLFKSVSDSTDAQYCGGTLIGDRLVLTAAHCVGNIDPTDIQVMIGENELPFGPGTRRDIVGFARHPQFNGATLEHDLAIIKLAQPVTNSSVTVARQSDAALYQSGTTATLLGWGMKNTDPKKPILPTKLQEAQIPIGDDAECLEEIGRFFKPASMMCAGKKATSSTSGDGVGPCFGDSGGPLLAPDGTGGWKLVGVVSWGFECASDKTRSVFADASVDESFISTPPTIAPYFLSRPVITGELKVGSTLTCALGDLGGDAPSSFSYLWYGGGVPIPDATGPTLTPDNTYTGLPVLCAASAKNAGGDSGFYYSEEVLIAPGSSNQATPTPVTTSSSQQDTTPPRATVVNFTCTARKCSIAIAANDADSGVQTVSAVAQIVYSGRCAKSKTCTKVKTKSVALRSKDQQTWKGSFSLPRKRNKQATVVVSTTDNVGNVAANAAKATEKL